VPGTVPAFEISTQSSGSRAIAALRGPLRHDDAAALSGALERLSREHPDGLSLDLAGVEELDGGAAAVLAEFLESARAGGHEIPLLAPPPTAAAMLALFRARDPRTCDRDSPVPTRTLEQIGLATIAVVERVRTSLAFLGECTLGLADAVRHPSTLRWSAVAVQIERVGADGVPIVLLIGFLVGLITAFQAAVQLAKLGADIFVADLVALSLTRELTPLLIAIVVAGRSGAAIAAEIGTMKVSEEIDALRAMGISPYRYLVFPRIAALTIALPLLTLAADAVGVAGGLLVALTQLDVGFVGYLHSTRDALDLSDVFGGLAKTVAFGFLIGFIACERGMATRGGAEGVGRSTTSAVVTILFYLILVDALFTVLYKMIGI
jgi:phospholipid/cholesterol/gamma-HCH transport system permease protein